MMFDCDLTQQTACDIDLCVDRHLVTLVKSRGSQCYDKLLGAVS